MNHIIYSSSLHILLTKHHRINMIKISELCFTTWFIPKTSSVVSSTNLCFPQICRPMILLCHKYISNFRYDEDDFEVHDDDFYLIIAIKCESLANDFATKYLLGIVYCLFLGFTIWVISLQIIKFMWRLIANQLMGNWSLQLTKRKFWNSP